MKQLRADYNRGLLATVQITVCGVLSAEVVKIEVAVQITILPVILYGCGTWCLILTVCEKRVVRRTFERRGVK
jgi:hypothetical protein